MPLWTWSKKSSVFFGLLIFNNQAIHWKFFLHIIFLLFFLQQNNFWFNLFSYIKSDTWLSTWHFANMYFLLTFFLISHLCTSMYQKLLLNFQKIILITRKKIDQRKFWWVTFYPNLKSYPLKLIWSFLFHVFVTSHAKKLFKSCILYRDTLYSKNTFQWKWIPSQSKSI